MCCSLWIFLSHRSTNLVNFFLSCCLQLLPLRIINFIDLGGSLKLNNFRPSPHSHGFLNGLGWKFLFHLFSVLINQPRPSSLLMATLNSKLPSARWLFCDSKWMIYFCGLACYWSLTRKHSISWKIIDSPHQSRPHKEILFPRYIISQSSGGPQLR